MTDRELMQMSLEYLIEFGMGEMPTAKALRDRLAQPEQDYEVTHNDDGTFSVSLPEGDELRIVPPKQPEQECIYPECETGIGCDGPCGEQPVDETAKRRHEPVGYIDGAYGGYAVFTPVKPAAVYPDKTALYTAPQKREWQGLTDEDIENLSAQYHDDKIVTVQDALKMADQFLMEKNT